MNMQQSILKISILIFLALGNTTSFGGELPLEEQGRHNLKKLYKNPDPKSVKKILHEEYVPVILLDVSPLTAEDIIIDVINPYHPSFYSNAAKINFRNKTLQSIKKARLHEAWASCKEKRTRQMLAMNLSSPTSFSVTKRIVNCPLVFATLFGDKNDISAELEKYIDNRNAPEIISALILRATLASLSYPYKNKENLPLLLVEQKKIQLYSAYAIPCREIESLHLLLCAAKNREEFDLIVKKDPYIMNNVHWKLNAEQYYGTNLDRMLEDSNFDKRHIKTFRDNGEITHQELMDRLLANDSGEGFDDKCTLFKQK